MGAAETARAAHSRVWTRQEPGIAGDVLDFGEHQGGFGFESLLHLLVIFLGEFAGAVLELQIAQIIVNDVAALHELIEHASGAERNRRDRARS